MPMGKHASPVVKFTCDTRLLEAMNEAASLLPDVRDRSALIRAAVEEYLDGRAAELEKLRPQKTLDL